MNTKKSDKMPQVIDDNHLEKVTGGDGGDPSAPTWYCRDCPFSSDNPTAVAHHGDTYPTHTMYFE